MTTTRKRDEFAKNWRNLEDTTNKLRVVAAMGGDLLVEAVHTADERDDVEFFEWAFGHWGPLITAVIEDYELPDRCYVCGHLRPGHTADCASGRRYEEERR